MVTSKPLWRWDDKFLRQPETGQRAFSCYFLVFIFAGLTSLSTRTTPEHNISCDGLQSWQTEKQHEKSPFLQHFHHKLSRSLPNLSKHRVVWGVLSNQTFLGCVCAPSKDLYTQSTNAATEGATQIASMDIILSFSLFFFLLYPLNPKVVVQD